MQHSFYLACMLGQDPVLHCALGIMRASKVTPFVTSQRAQTCWEAGHLAAAEGGLVVAAAQVASFMCDAVVHVLCEAVQHADCLLAHADVRVDLLQHPVDVDLRTTRTACHIAQSLRTLHVFDSLSQ